MTETASPPLDQAALPSRRSHLLDVLFFRLLATGTLVHEVLLTETAETTILVGAICLFFMPDWLRGKDSIPARLLARLIGPVP